MSIFYSTECPLNVTHGTFKSAPDMLSSLSVSNSHCSFLQTFVNDVRIQEQSYVTLKIDDKLRFGYDILRLCLLSFVCVGQGRQGNAVTLSVLEKL